MHTVIYTYKQLINEVWETLILNLGSEHKEKLCFLIVFHNNLHNNFMENANHLEL